MPVYTPAKERLKKFVTVNPAGCHLFTGNIDKCGYGKLEGGRDFPGETLAHRVSFMVHVGPIPAGKEIDHLCNVRNCVNPQHLMAVTHAENIKRADYKTNHRNATKTFCKRGHEFTPENTLQNRWGSKVTRKCRTCTQAAIQRRRAENAKSREIQEVFREATRRRA